MLLLRELNEEVEYLEEDNKSGGKTYYIKGPFLQSNIKNRNGRKYPKDTMIKEATRYIREVVENDSAWGELGHPSGPQINLERVSHRIVELNLDKNDYIGKAMLAETPMGSIAVGLLKTGGKLGISSRGMGSLKPDDDGTMIVQDDYKISSAGDIVADPSAPGAWLKSMMENVEYIWDEKLGWKVLEQLEDTKKYVKENYKKINEEHKLKMFNNFLSSINNK